MKIGYIIICRYNSSRLPGKILKKIEGKEILMYIYERIRQVASKDQVVVATSVEAEDDKIAAFCAQNDISCYRGPLDNVAWRFLKCAEQYGFEYATRINGDNIFMDTETLRNMTAITRSGGFQFISNLKNRTFPRGMSVEIVNVDYYKSIYPKFNDDTHKEHVTLYMYENEKESDNFYYFFNTSVPEAAGIQLAIDNESDFSLVTKIIRRFDRPHTDYGLKEIIQIRADILEGK
ncbi:MAG TPA: hypothetical protein VE870_14340 [Bacteroidales bacterium]|nr:hypothetical protein [Bacteroidales bacterium]